MNILGGTSLNQMGQLQHQPQAAMNNTVWSTASNAVDPYFCRIKKVENGYIVVVNYREYIVENLDKLPAILVAAEMTK